MPVNTIVEGAKLSQDKLVPGIVEEVVAECPLLRLLPFKDIVGTGLSYNREDPANMPTVGFKAVGQVWTESTAKFIKRTAPLYTLGDDADVDNFIAKTMGNFTDQMEAQVKIKSKVLGHEFEWQTVYGNSAESEGFDGLHQMMLDASGQQIRLGNEGLSVSDHLDLALDMLTKGTPSAILMNKQMRRAITKYLRSTGQPTVTREKYGHMWQVWGDDEVPFVISDAISSREAINPLADNEWLAPSGGASTSIFVVMFGDEEGLVGLQNGGIQTETWKKLEMRNASRTRLIWYCGMALYSTISIVRISGINPAADVTA